MKQFLPQNPQDDTNGKLRITQYFGERPEFYQRYGLKGHEGIDINPTPGVSTPVYAAFDGNTYIRKGGAYGNKIDLYDDKGIVASYCHLREIIITKAQRVKAGDLIGYSGNTTNYNGMAIHLHFMIKECDPNDGTIYNERNGYLGSIPVYFDEVENKLFIDTEKEYFKSETGESNELLLSINQEQAERIEFLENDNERLRKKIRDAKSVLDMSPEE